MVVFGKYDHWSSRLQIIFSRWAEPPKIYNFPSHFYCLPFLFSISKCDPCFHSFCSEDIGDRSRKQWENLPFRRVLGEPSVSIYLMVNECLCSYKGEQVATKMPSRWCASKLLALWSQCDGRFLGSGPGRKTVWSFYYWSDENCSLSDSQLTFASWHHASLAQMQIWSRYGNEPSLSLTHTRCLWGSSRPSFGT